MTDSKDWQNGGPKMDRRGALECKRLGGNRLLRGSRAGRADNLGIIPQADPYAFAAVMPLDNPGGEDRVSSIGLSWSHILIALLMFAIPCVSLKPNLSLAQNAEDPKDVIATQIRSQGFGCYEPIRADRDLLASIPDERVWLLQCEEGSYRIRLIPHMAAKVERTVKINR
jgi:hypothetical protein